MSLHLTKLQKQLCNILQEGLPICPRPFAEIAGLLESDEETVLQEVKTLKDMKVIRRISAILDYRALGKTSTLVAAHIRQEDLKQIIKAINLLEGVSHNYLRKHYYNLWFTLQVDSAEQIEVTLSNLAARFGVDFYSLPVRRIFKLDVRFDAQNQEKALLQDIEQGMGGLNGQVQEQKSAGTVELNQEQKLVLSKLQNDLKIAAESFGFLCDEGLDTKKTIRVVKELIDKGLIRRIAAIIDHRRLGFVANVLFCCKIEQSRIIEVGRGLARFGIVSHCYERETVKGWPYNLFAMMHSRSMGEIQHIINRFTTAEKIDSFELLPTESELKKQPIKHKFH